MRPRQVIESWVEAFNRADVAGLAELYSDNAVNHQVAAYHIVGRDNIRTMFVREFEQAPMTCIVENIFEDGEWAILEWSDPLGLRGCGFFRVVEGQIVIQRGYWDQLSFQRLHGLSAPIEQL